MCDDSTGRPCPYLKALLTLNGCGAHCAGIILQNGSAFGGYRPRYIQIALQEYDYRL